MEAGAPTSNNDSSKSSSKDASTCGFLCECLIPGMFSFVIPILRPNLAKIGSSTSTSPLGLELLKDIEDGGVLDLDCAEPFGKEVWTSEALGLPKGAVAKATGEERVSSIPCIMLQNWLNGSPGSD